MAEIYRVEKGSEEWKYKAYDYVRTDAFCCGQNIPIELEFGQDESKDDLQAILLTEDHKPVAGCRIAFPAEKTGKIERVCVVREKQKSGYGRVLVEAAEKWLKEYGVDHIAITSPSPSPISIETTASSSVIGSFVSNSGMDENTSETSNNFPMIFVLSYTYFSTSTQVKPRFFFGFFGSSSFFSAWWSYTDRSASGFSL